ncbi:MAG: hypothetical protein V4506_13975 [Bacteroidota bacterium]
MRKIKLFIFCIITVILICSSFKPIGPIFVTADADAELIISDVKVKIIGLSEFTFTQVNGNFYNQVSSQNSFLSQNDKEKLFNNDVYVNSVSTMFSLVDSTYKIVDSTLMTSPNDNFTWEFMDLTDTNTIIQYTTTKSITRASQFDLLPITTVNKSLGFSYSHPLVQADSITYLLGADSLTSIKKTVYNQSYGVTYSAAELNTLTTTNEGAFMILVYNTMPQIYNGKKYYFQNNSVVMVMPLPIN